MKKGLVFISIVFRVGLARICFAQEIRDIRPPVYFPANHIFIYLFIAIVCVAVVVYLVRRILLKKPQACNEPALIRLRPAHEAAFEALRALKEKKLIEKGFVKEYYFELSAIIRRYLESRFSIKAVEMTTEEFLQALRQSQILAGEHKNILKQFLQHADLVKFAKYGPTREEADKSFSCVEKLIDVTRQKQEKITDDISK